MFLDNNLAASNHFVTFFNPLFPSSVSIIQTRPKLRNKIEHPSVSDEPLPLIPLHMINETREQYSRSFIMASEPLPLSPSIVPSNDAQNDELLFLSDPKFARHGEILFLVFVLLFSFFLSVIAVFMFMKRVRSHLNQNEGLKLDV